MKKYFSIGETAKINNISIQALRLYDKMDLLKPAYVDPESNYRYYTINQFVYIDLIKYSKLIGAPLKDLREVFQNNDIVNLLSFIREQQEGLEKEIIRLNNIKRSIRFLGDKIDYAMDLKETNEVYFRQMEKRFIVEVALNEKDEESDVQIKLRKFDKILEDNEIMYEGEIGSYIYSDLLFNKDEFSYKSIYSTLCVNDVKNKYVDIKEIPAGTFICIAYLNDDRQQALEKIKKFMKKNNVNPKGDVVETQLFNTIDPWKNDDLIYELQIFI